MSIIVYFVMITECGNEKVARSVIRSRKVVILCVITEYGNKNIVCFVIHRINYVWYSVSVIRHVNSAESTR